MSGPSRKIPAFKLSAPSDGVVVSNILCSSDNEEADDLEDIERIRDLVSPKAERRAKKARELARGGVKRSLIESELQTIFMKEHSAILKELKGERNADRILSAYQALAAFALVRVMVFGDKQDAKSAAKEILDRALGRSIERKMTLSLNVDGMTLAEVENELQRITSGDVGRPEAKALEATFTEGEDFKGDAGGEVRAEPDSEAVSGESSEDKGADSK